MTDLQMQQSAGDATGYGSEEEPEGLGIEISRLFTNHKLILLAALGIGAYLGYEQYKRSPAVYASEARLQVTQNIIDSPVEGGTGPKMAAQTVVQTHAEVIASPKILEAAVERGNLEELESLRGSSDPAAKIRSGLRAAQSKRASQIMDLSYRGPSAADTKVVLEAIIAAYIDYVADSQKSDNARRLGKLVDEKKGLEEKIAKLEADYEAFLATTSLVRVGGEVRNMHRERQGLIEQQRREVALVQLELQAELEAIDRAMKSETDPEAIVMMALNQLPRGETVEGSTADYSDVPLPEIPIQTPLTESFIPTTNKTLLPLLVEEQTLSKKYGAKSPKMIEIRDKIATMRALLQAEDEERRRALEERNAKLLAQAVEMQRLRTLEMERQEAIRRANAAAKATSEKPVEASDLLTTYLAALRERLREATLKIDKLNEEYDREEKAARLVGFDENRDRVLREEIERQKQYFNDYSKKLQAISFTENELFIIVEPIQTPKAGYKVAPKLTDNLLLGSILGLLAGLGIALLFENADRSFRTPEDVQRRLKLPVIAHIPKLEKLRAVKGSKLHKSLVSFHRPASRFAEAYRTIRTPLLFRATQDNWNLLQITSPDPGDGKSTLCANLAITLASSGKRVLLIDCDFRRPKVGKLFGLETATGFADVIQDGVELSDAIHSCEATNLDVMAAGAEPKNVTELVLSPRFDEAIQVLREKYDFVLLDSPPVLAVTDASALAAKADAVLLVLRITPRSSVDSLRAKKTLSMVGANFLGAVINTHGETRRGYGYGYGGGNYDYSAYAGSGSYFNRDRYHSEEVRSEERKPREVESELETDDREADEVIEGELVS